LIPDAEDLASEDILSMQCVTSARLVVQWLFSVTNDHN